MVPDFSGKHRSFVSRFPAYTIVQVGDLVAKHGPGSANHTQPRFIAPRVKIYCEKV
ncbi:hypothetical protein [Teichococcus vastitatis]|uniref:Uncharacterized protein n=1 Tax=Teichococcus vastitatis TaxID=2307076 RepID=A0ABS9W369_9PROT|nr:hypothetical protein [Pseudoroseomonas vastitatis]MCI0753626.1 hypothetical protein [Pseudoroseomonas vastitatis]